MQDSPASDPVAKYRLKLKTNDGKDYDEEVQIDTQKETETFHVPKTSPDNEEADIVLDFKKVSDYRSIVFINFELLLGSGGVDYSKKGMLGERG